MPVNFAEMPILWARASKSLCQTKGWEVIPENLHRNVGDPEDSDQRGIWVSGQGHFQTAFLKPAFWWEAANEKLASILAQKVSVPVPNVEVGLLSKRTKKWGHHIGYCCSPSVERKTRTLYETFEHLTPWQHESVQRCVSTAIPFALWVGSNELNEAGIVIPRKPKEAYAIDFSCLSWTDNFVQPSLADYILQGNRPQLYCEDIAIASANRIAELPAVEIKASMDELCECMPCVKRTSSYWPGHKKVLETLKVRQSKIQNAISRESLLDLPVLNVFDYALASPARGEQIEMNAFMRLLFCS